MKIKLMAMLMAVFAGYAHAEASSLTLSGGAMQFVGSLTDGPCAVQATIGERVVTLQQVKESSLLTPGEAAGQVKIFRIVLNDCNISVYTNVAVSFSGQTDTVFKSVLVNQAAEDPAQNVGLQLYGPDGKKIIPDDSSSVTLATGLNVIPLSVDYVPVGMHAKAGNVASTVTFNIHYS